MKNRLAHHYDHCPRCHVARHADVDRKTGRAHVTYAAQCPHKDKCARELLTDAGFSGIEIEERP